MQVFKDPVSGQVWAFEDDVTARKDKAGAYFFSYTVGDDPTVHVLDVPSTLKPCSEDEATDAAKPNYTPDQIVALNTSVRNELLERASTAIAPMQLAISLGEATDDEKSSAREWVDFTRAVKSVDLTSRNPDWPTRPDLNEASRQTGGIAQ